MAFITNILASLIAAILFACIAIDIIVVKWLPADISILLIYGIAILYIIYKLNQPDAVKRVRFTKSLEKLERKKFGSIKEILKEYVRREGGLDFAACIYHGDVEYAVYEKQLCDRLVKYEIGRTIKQQANYYLNLAEKIHKIKDDANGILEELKQGALFRVVFDVKQGGFFYYSLSDIDYIIGATVEQDVMNDDSADLELRSMVRTIEKFIKNL